MCWLHEQTYNFFNYLWKIKVPLKIKIFMWFLFKKVLVTKDNLAKRHWNGCIKYVFCDSQETVDHLFISCLFARLIWRVVHFTYNIPPPINVTNIFGNWLNGIVKKTKARIRVGVCALVWAIWNCRNDVVFNRVQKPNFLQEGGFYNPHVVLPPSCEAARTYGYWVQSTDGSCTGYLQSGSWQLSKRIQDA
jgi:hypothetical protein